MRQYNKSDGRTKRCPKCGITKVLDAFQTHTLKGKQRISWCKMCESEFIDKERRRVKRHEYYLKHKDKWIEYNKIRPNRNEYMRKYMRLYYLRVKFDEISL